MRRSDATWMWSTAIGKIAEYDDDGKPVRFYGVNLDIDKERMHQEALDSQKQFIQTLLDSQEQIIITTNGETIVTANESFFDFFAINTIDEFKEVYDARCICDTFNTCAPQGFLQVIMEDESWIDYIINRPFSKNHKAMISREGKNFIFSVSAAELPGEEGLKSAVFTDITVLESQRTALEELHRNISDSIEYASLIQGALIPDPQFIRKHFDDYFALWHPKDVVGGDIFLFEEINSKNEVLLMCIDCTGHGVPGAFVTMLVKAIERQIIGTLERMQERISPAKILQIFNRSIKHMLGQDHRESISNAGFDGSIVYYNKTENLIRFAGANLPLYLRRSSGLEMIKGDRHSIGYKKSDPDYEFTDHEIAVNESMSVYLVTDGYLDQIGGEKEFSFGRKRFMKLIEEHGGENMADQQEYFLEALTEYQGDHARIDDVTLVAFKVHKNEVINENNGNFTI